MHITKPLQFDNDDRRSLERPAWTSEDMHAYRHKHTARNNGSAFIIKDYFVKTGGLAFT